MKQTDLAWLAGLLEGEGHFTDRDAPRIDLRMVDGDIVRRAAYLMGSKVGRVRPATSGRQPTYRCAPRVGISLEVMRMILPYMGRRRSKRIRAILRRRDET
jgi:hypothetical protein